MIRLECPPGSTVTAGTQAFELLGCLLLLTHAFVVWKVLGAVNSGPTGMHFPVTIATDTCWQFATPTVYGG